VRDIDELVREIEGEPPPVARTSRNSGSRRRLRGAPTALDGRCADNPCEGEKTVLVENFADTYVEDVSSPYLEPADMPVEQENIEQDTTRLHTPRKQSSNVCAHCWRPTTDILIKSGDWSVQRLSSACCPPGTFYTVEVLGHEPDLPNCSFESGHLGSIDGHYANQVRNRRCSRCRNPAVTAARCRGYPVAELSLIPLDAIEVAEAAQLAQDGITLVAAADIAIMDMGLSPRQPQSTSSSSLPDRDAAEEYLAWCSEAQQQYRETPSHTAGADGVPDCRLAAC